MSDHTIIKIETEEETSNTTENEKDGNSSVFVKYGRRTLAKGTPAYYEMRERNNKAIHKHRQKKRDELKIQAPADTPTSAVPTVNRVKKQYDQNNIKRMQSCNDDDDEDEDEDENESFINRELPKIKQFFESPFFDIIVKSKFQEIIRSLECDLGNFS
jgi:hypothetical protein